MATVQRNVAHNPTYHTVFLIPNLHCPTCITRIEAILADLAPAPTLVNVSIVSHSVTVEHVEKLPALSIIHALSAAGYEVFDVVLDVSSDEHFSFMHGSDGDGLQAAVMRWDPKQSSISSAAREKHELNCQMCAAHRTAGPDAVVAVPPTRSTSDYIAVLAIDGMTCSSCIGNVARALREVPSVSQAEVALVNHSATVHFNSEDPDTEKRRLIDAVEDVGYGAEVVEIKPQQSTKQTSQEEQDEVDGPWQVTYTIEGMTCSSCVNATISAVDRLQFVERTEINLVQHSGTVKFRGKQNVESIKQTIDDIGYDATEIELKSLAQKKQTSPARTISLNIGGMYCPHCPQRLASALQSLPLEKIRMPTLQDPILTISYTPNAPELTLRSIINTIADLDNAFSVSIHRPPSVEERSQQMLIKERRAILARTVFTLIIAIPTFIIGVVYMSLVPHSNPSAQFLMTPLHGVSRAEWATFVMATPVYFLATDYFHRRTLKEIYSMWRPRSTVPLLQRFYRFGSMNMLISLGTTIAYFASLAELIIGATTPSGSIEASRSAYFDSVVFLTMFLLLGRYAEANMKAKSGDAISALGNLRPTEALLKMGDDDKSGFEKIEVDLVDIGDIVRVPHGSSPPCDGALLDGAAQLDESSLTGESAIVKKHTGDILYSGTINKGPAVSIRVTGYAGASMLDSIIQVVREGQAKRAPVERVADILTAYFVPVVVAIAIITWMIWLGLGLSTLPKSYLDNDIGGWPFWSLQFSIAVFVIACPCGLGLAAPTALFVGSGMAAKRGILVKGGGEAFQEASSLDCVVFDKTGTLTEGAEPKIAHHQLYSNSSFSQEEILAVLKAVEENSTHPLGKAAVAFARAQTAVAVNVVAAEEIAGKGLSASFILPARQEAARYQVLIGNERLMQDHSIQLPKNGRNLLETWKAEGNSILISAARELGKDMAEWSVTGLFAAADAIREEAPHVVASLQTRNIEVWMLSGDNQRTAIAVAAKVGIPAENVIAGVLPAQKAEKVQYLQRTVLPSRRRGWANRLIKQRSRATVAMVGDGINDTPALAAADVGIAVASGSDVAVQSASFILVHSDLRAVLSLVTLSRAVFQRVILNFFWAAIYNLVALPVAAGVLYPITTADGSHVRLDPAWAALAMALSSVSVVGSSLLLRTRLPLVGFRG